MSRFAREIRNLPGCTRPITFFFRLLASTSLFRISMILFNPQHAFYYFYRINLSSHVHQSFSHHVTFIPHCTTLPLSLSLSLTRSWRSPVSTFNLNLYRKSIVIFAIISSLTRCPGVLIVLPVLSPLSLPLPLLSNLWSFGRHSSLALTLFFIINDFFLV